MKFSDYAARRDIINWLENNNFAASEENVALVAEHGLEAFRADEKLAEGLAAKTVVTEENE